MSNGWGGADPASFVDAADYELGTHYVALADVTLTDFRIFGGNGSTMGGRAARLWSPAGTVLATVALPNTITPGWNNYALGTPYAVTNGTEFWVSYATVDAYGFLGGIAYPVNSADARLRALEAAFNNNPAVFPNSLVSNGFFGVDVVFTPGITGNMRPVAGLVVQPTATPLQVQADVTIADESPATCSVVVEWGDGASSNRTGPGSLTHTYAVAGTYPVMVTVTDTGGLSDGAAALGNALTEASASELERQRYLTARFIAADPTAVAFTRYPRVANGSGGYVKGAPVAIAAQNMKLVRLGDTAVERTTEDGRSVAPTFVLVAPWNADLQRWDEFTWNGHVLQVVYVDNRGYEAKAEVIYLG